MKDSVTEVASDGGIVTSTGAKHVFKVTEADFASVRDAVVLDRQVLQNGVVTDSTVQRVETSDGARFFLFTDGTVLFDAGPAAEGLAQGVTRQAQLNWVDSQGRQQSLSVEFGGQSIAIAGVSALETADKTGQAIAGTFHQKAPVDVIQELFKSLDDSVSIDLDSLLDVQVLDIDTTFELSFDAVKGLEFKATDNRSGDALVTNLGAKLDPVFDLANEISDVAFSSVPLPVTFGPTFNLSFGLQANLGWDVSLPTLGKTSFHQPVELALYLPDGPVATGERFSIGTGGLTSLTPTAVTSTAGLGSININAGVAVSDMKMTGLGFAIGTKDLLDLPLEGLARAALTLNADFDLDAALLKLMDDLGAPPPDNGTALPAVSLDFGIETILRGIVAVKDLDAVEVIKTAIKELTAKEKNEVKIFFALQNLRELIQKSIELGSGDFVPTFDVGGAQLESLELLALSERAQFGAFDFRDANGTGHFQLDTEAGEQVEVSGDRVLSAAEQSGVTEILSSVRNLFGEEGFSPFEGLTFKAGLPIGNVEEYQGFGHGVTGPRAGVQQITVEQATTLAGLSIDFEKLAPELVNFAIDAISKAALKSVKAPPVIAVIAGATLAAKTGLQLQEEYDKTLQSGFKFDAQLDTAGLVAGLMNPALQLLNTVYGELNNLTGSSIPAFELISEDAPQADIERHLKGVQNDLATSVRGIFSLFDEVSSTIDALQNTVNATFETVEPLIDVVSQSVRAVYYEMNRLIDKVKPVLGAVENILKAFGIRINIVDRVEEIRDVFGAIDALNDGLEGAIDGAFDAVRALVDNVKDLPGKVESLLNGAFDLVVDTLIDVSKGFELAASVEFNWFDFLVDAGIEVVQIAKFDPDNVDISYTLEGVTQKLNPDQQVEFLATGAVGSLLEGEVTYNFSGDVDYDYRLRLNVDPQLTLFNTKVNGSVRAGGTDFGDFEVDYSLVETTRDVDFETFSRLFGQQQYQQLLQFFDDALVEIPLELFDQIAQVAVDGIRESLGPIGAHSADLPWNEIRLFRKDDIELTSDQFTEIRQAFQVAVGGAASGVNVLQGEGLSEDTVGFHNFGNKFDAPVVSINGAVENVDTLVKLAFGTVFVTPEGVIQFSTDGDFDLLAAGQAQTVSFTYELATGVEGTALFEVLGQNDAPVAVLDQIGVNPGETSILRVLSNDFDVDQGDQLTLVSASSNTGGTVEVLGNTLRYTPAAGYSGVDAVTYVIRDASGVETTGTAEVTVYRSALGDFDGRVSQDSGAVDLASLLEGMSPETRILAVNGEAVNVGQPLSIKGGTLTVGADGSVRFDPGDAFAHLPANTTEQIQFTISIDGFTNLTRAITVEGQNDAPTATEDSFRIGHGQPVLLDVLANDSDPDAGDQLSLISADAGVAGSAQIVDGRLRITPADGVSGRVEVTYVTRDSQGAEAQGTAVLYVAPPTRLDVSVGASAPATEITDHVLFSDSSQGFTVARVNGSADAVGQWVPSLFGGSYKVNADGSYEIDPAGDFDWLPEGQKIFEDIRIEFATGEQTHIVYRIHGEARPPRAGDDHATTAIDTLVSVAVLENDIDLQSGESPQITAVSAQNGTAQIDGDKVVFTPDQGFEGLARIDVTIADAGGASTTSALHVEVGNANITRLGSVGEDATEAPLINVLAALGIAGQVTAVNGQTPGTITLASGAQIHLAQDGTLRVDAAGAYEQLAQGQSARVYLDIEVGGLNRTVSFDVIGANDAPIAHNDRAGVETGQAIGWNVAANDIDPDAGDTLTVVEVDDHPGGTVRIAGPSHIVFTPNGEILGDLDLRYVVEDSHGLQSEAIMRVSVMPNGDTSTPAHSGPTQSLTTTEVTGTFSQRGGIDVGAALINFLKRDTGFDLNDLLDFTLIDIDTIYTLEMDTVDGISLSADHAYAPNGVLAGAFVGLEDALSTAADAVGTNLNVDLGALELSPEIVAKLGLDLHFGWDIDLITLGQTAFNQPVAVDLTYAERVVQGQSFTVSTNGLRAFSPTSVTETIGLGSTNIYAGLDLAGTEVGEFGFGVKSSDFGPFNLDGVFDMSARLNRSFSLGEVEAFIQQFQKDVVSVLGSVASLNVPANDLIDLAYSIDSETVLRALFSGELDLEALYDLFEEKDQAKAATQFIDFLLNFLQSGRDELPRHEINGVSFTHREIYDLSQDARFGQFDQRDDDGKPSFARENSDGETVLVTALELEVARELLGIDEQITGLVTAVERFGVSLGSFAKLQLDLPVGNTQEVQGFGLNADGSADTATRDGLERITVSQTTELISVELDFETLQKDVFKSLLSLIPSPPPPGLDLLILTAAAQDEAQRIFEAGSTASAEIQPKQLVLTVMNAVIKTINAPLNALNSIFPGVNLGTVGEISADQLNNGFDAALDFAFGVVRDGFKALFDSFDLIVDFMRPIASGGSAAITDNLGRWVELFFDEVTRLDLGIFDKLAQGLKDFQIGWCPIGCWHPLHGFGETLEDWLGHIRKIFHGGSEQNYQGGVRGFINDARDVIATADKFIADITAFDPLPMVDYALGHVRGLLENAAEEISLEVSTGFNLFDAKISAGIDLIQTAAFDPDAVEAVYTYGGQEVRAGLGETVTFDAQGTAGEVTKGEVEYLFSGNVDYDYRLEIDITPVLNLFETQIRAKLKLGSEEIDLSHAYSLLKTGETSPLRGDGLLSQFDEALIELNFDILNKVIGAVQKQVADMLGIDIPDHIQLEDNQVLLFFLEDVPLGQDRFDSITHEFDVRLVDEITQTLGNIAPVAQDAALLYDASGARLPTAVALSVSDVDNDSLSFRVASGADLGTFSFVGDKVIFVPRIGLDGVHQAEIVVSDGQAETAFALNLSENSLAELSSTPQIDLGLSRDSSGQLAANDADGQSVTFSLRSALPPEFGTFTLAADGSYQINLTAEAAGSQAVTVGLYDGIATREVTLTIIAKSNQPDQAIFGTAADEVLTGTSGNDTIEGGAGDDAINGAGGDDILVDHAGSDTYRGGAGADLLRSALSVAEVRSGLRLDRGDGAGRVLIELGGTTDVIHSDIEQVQFRDGLLTITQTPAAGALFSIELRDTAGVVHGSGTFFDTGTLSLESYGNGVLVRRLRIDAENVEPWRERLEIFDETGALIREELTEDNGILGTYLYADGVLRSRFEQDSEQVAAFVEELREYDETGTLTYLRSLLDTGFTKEERYTDGVLRSRIVHDTGNNESWGRRETTYDASGDITEVKTLFDNSDTQTDAYIGGIVRETQRVDHAGSEIWRDYSSSFDASGALIREVINFDDGLEVTNTYQSAVLNTRLERDLGDTNPFVERFRQFDDNGNITFERNTSDQGVYAEYTYAADRSYVWTEEDRDNAFGWDRFETTYDSNGVITGQVRIDDNGLKTTYSFTNGIETRRFEEDLGNAVDFTTRDTSYGADGQTIVQQDIHYDDGVLDQIRTAANGVVTTYHHDPSGTLRARLETAPVGVESFVKRQRIYEENGQVTREITDEASGTRTTTTYVNTYTRVRLREDLGNTEAWASYEEQFGTDGKVATEIVTGDDGLVTTYTYADGVLTHRLEQARGGGYDFILRERHYNPSGQVTHETDTTTDGLDRSYGYSNGHLRSKFQRDITGTRDWETIDTRYGTDGRIAEETTLFDTGLQKVVTYASDRSRVEIETDTKGAFSWQRFETSYRADGVITGQLRIDDDGLRVTYSFDAAGETVSRLEQDLGNAHGFLERLQEYDATGAVVRELTTADDGTSREIVHAPNGVETVYERDASGALTRRFETDHKNAIDFETRERLYDAAGNVAAETVLFDDGTVTDYTYENGHLRRKFEQDHDNTQSWQSYETRYDAQGRVALEVVVQDSGLRVTRTYSEGTLTERFEEDLTNQDFYITRKRFYDADGQVNRELLTRDNGVAEEFRYSGGNTVSWIEDDLQNAHGWTRFETYYDTAGRIREQLRIDDDGLQLRYVYEAGVLVREDRTDGPNVKPYHSLTRIYNADGTLKSAQSVEDDGSQIAFSYENGLLTQQLHSDPTDVLPFTQRLQKFRADGVVIFDRKEMDDGTVSQRVAADTGLETTSYFGADGALTQTHERDLSNLHSYAERMRYYGDSGALIREIETQDNGVQVTRHFENGTLNRALFEDLGEAHQWASIVVDYDAAGNITRELLTEDSGTQIENTYADGVLIRRIERDAGNTAQFKQIDQQFDAAGNLISETTEQDNGTIVTLTSKDGTITGERLEDRGNVKTWLSLQSNFGEDGQRIGQNTLYDDGTTSTTTFDAGAPVTLVENDLQNARDYAQRTVIYDQSGGVRLETHVLNDGRRVVSETPLNLTTENDAPVFLTSNLAAVSAGGSYQIRALDPDSASVTYRLIEGEGFALNGDTGVLTHIGAAVAVPTSYSLMVEASDGSLATQQSLTVFVSPGGVITDGSGVQPGAGADVFATGPEARAHIGAGGDDTFLVSAGQDAPLWDYATVTPSGTLTTANGNAELADLSGLVRLSGRYDGGAGRDVMQASDRSEALLLHHAPTGQVSDFAPLLTSVEVLSLGGGDDLVDLAGSLPALAYQTSVTIDGGAGDDTLIGGAGQDSLTGGDGADLFAFSGATLIGRQIITDFTIGTDKIALWDFGLSDFDQAVQDGSLVLTVENGDTVITVAGQGGSVVLKGVTQPLSASDIQLRNAPLAINDIALASDTGVQGDFVTTASQPEFSFTVASGSTVEIDWGQGYVSYAPGVVSTDSTRLDTPQTYAAPEVLPVGVHTATIRVTAADGTQSTQTQRFAINSAPQINDGSVVVAPEGPGRRYIVDLGIADVEGQALSVNVQNGDAFGTFGLSDGALVFDALPSLSGEHTLQVDISDGFETTSAMLNLRVADTFNATDDVIRIGAKQTYAGNLSHVISPEGPLTFTNISGAFSQFGALTLAADGSIFFDPIDTVNGSFTLRYSAKDSYSSAEGTVTFLVDAQGPAAGNLSLSDASGAPIGFTTKDRRPALSFSTETGAKIAVDWGAGFVDYGVALAGVQRYLAPADLSVGQQIVTLRLTDEFGNINTVSQTVEITGTGSEPATVNGNSESNVITAGGGSQIIKPGAGDDLIVLGGGEDTIADRLDHILGDTVNDFGTDDQLVFTDTQIARDQLTVTQGSALLDVDTNRDGISDGRIVLKGDFTTGDFIVIGRNGATTITYETFLPQLANQQAVNAAQVNGIVSQEYLTGDGATDFRVTLNDMAQAGFDNVVGVYEIDASGNIVDTRILFANANSDIATIANITGVEAGHRLGFFVVQDAAHWASTLEQSDVLSFVDSSGAAGNVADGSALSLAVNGLATDEIVFHSFDAALNADGVEHVLSGVDRGGRSISIGFEDLLGGGDRDYEDLVFRVEAMDALPFV